MRLKEDTPKEKVSEAVQEQKPKEKSVVEEKPKEKSVEEKQIDKFADDSSSDVEESKDEVDPEANKTVDFSKKLDSSKGIKKNMKNKKNKRSKRHKNDKPPSEQ